MDHKKGVRKRQRECVEKALGFDDSLSADGDDKDVPSFEEWSSKGIVFGVCLCCGCELVKYVDGFGCPKGCYFVPFPK